MEVLDKGWYKLGCSVGRLDTHYQETDLEGIQAELVSWQTNFINSNS